VLAAAVVGALVATRFFAIAASAGEADEAIFAGAVTRFDLFDLSPQAPGFPVWILIGRALAPFCAQPFTALAVASTLLAACMLPALYAWGRRLVGGWAALAGVALAAAIPVVFVNGGRAFTDTPSTALFLIALALLGAAEDAPSSRETYRKERASGRRARLLAIGAGLCAAAGAGVRPHLVLAFGPAIALAVWRLARRGDRHDAAISVVLSGLAGSSAWLVWLVAQAGGPAGLLASLRERAGFRAYAMATGRLGGFFDSFLVRDALSPRRALLLAVLTIAGLLWLVARRRSCAATFLVILVPTFWSLWFLHSRAAARYSVPFVLIASLLVGTGLLAILRKGPLVLLAGAALSAWYFASSWPEARWGATHDTPPAQAVAALERYVHPGRETIVADDIFHAFLRTERWEGRLVAWGYLDSELVSGVRQANARYVRLADFTGEPGPPDRRDPLWRSWSHTGRVAERLGLGRLLEVAVRDPAPPLFGPGFGVKEKGPGQPSFRWAGRSARVIVPGLDGPPVAILSGERPSAGGPTTLTVKEAATGRLVLARPITPGSFDLVIASPPVFGPLARPLTYVVSCDRPLPLPPAPETVRPAEACFSFLDSTFSMPPEALWMPRLSGRVLDLGAPWDVQGDPQGFHDRETLVRKLDMRWTGRAASVLYVPHPGVLPARLVLRCRAPFADAVPVHVTVGNVAAGTLVVPPGDFGEVRLVLPPAAVEALHGRMPLRIELSMPAVSPKQAGRGDDPRPLGIGVDWIALE
jgi:hypothetical protein